MTEIDTLHSTGKVYKPREYETEERKKWKSTLAQFYVTCVECIFLTGITMTATVPMNILGALHNKVGDPMALNDEEASWIGSILLIFPSVVGLASGFLSERFGRRGGMMMVNIPFLAGWILLYYAHSVQGLYIAVLTMGLGIGFSEAPVAAYMGEISEPRLRSVLNNITAVTCTFGYMIEIFFGSSFDLQTLALLSAIVPIVSFVLFPTIPESPVWLISKGRLKDAQRALGWLRGFLKPEDVQKEFDELVRYTNLSQALSNDSSEIKDEEFPLDNKSKPLKEASESWLKARYNELKNPKLYLPLRFILISTFFGQASGLGPFRSYLVGILQQFWFPIDRKWILTMSGAIPFVGSMIPMFIITRTGKRGLALPCMSISAICILTLGLFASFYTDIEDLLWSWLLITNLAVYFLVTSLGNVYWMMFGEIFPIRGKGLAAGLSTFWACSLGFILSKSYLSFQGLIGLSGMFYVYGFITLLGCVYFYFHMPETEGKTMERIETYFTPNHDRKEKFSMPQRGSSKA